MKKNFRKVLLPSLYGGNFFLFWGLSDFSAFIAVKSMRKIRAVCLGLGTHE